MVGSRGMKRRSDIDVVPHLDMLWRYARVLTRNDADADDLVQEALTRALTLGHTYDRSRPLAAWLVRIVRNTFLTGRTRRHAEARRIETLSVVGRETQPAEQVNRLQLAQVTAAFEALPAEHAEILHVIAVLGFSYQDAADMLGIPMGTVMSRLNRARTALRDLVGETDTDAKVRLRVVGGTDGTG